MPPTGRQPYGLAPVQPRKKRSKGTHIAALVIVPLVLLFLYLAAPCSIVTTDTRDARRAEAEQQLGSNASTARRAFSRMERAPARLTGSLADGGSGVEAAGLTGEHYAIDDRVFDLGGGKAALLAHPKDPFDGWGVHTFAWQGGSGDFQWDGLDTEQKALDFIAGAKHE